ncbi:hypothetical protein ABG768_017190 [Culter alburnus]|uniref:Chemokine interleukin-8-like domain-containing protein n=1 Tax=Culter alburnus TaxID=194366 RepID=A0AAW1YX85_CULAL
MRCVSITPLLFLATVLFAQVTCQMSGPSTCLCLKTSETVLRKENIRSYKIQKAGVCQIDAVQFKTIRGLTFCSDPQKPWVKRAIEYVDKKKNANKTTERPINSTSTFKTTSMPKTTSAPKTTSMPKTTSAPKTTSMPKTTSAPKTTSLCDKTG